MLKTVGFPSTRTGDQTIIDGNLVIGTAGKGIDFSATPGTGTSELLADYEEGTWTPTDASGAALAFSNASGYYTKIGRVVTVHARFDYPATADASTAIVGGLPFTSLNADGAWAQGAVPQTSAGAFQGLSVPAGGTSIFPNGGPGLGTLTNANLSGSASRITVVYTV